MPESLGPHFFGRVFREEGNKGASGDQDAAPYEKYLLELSATGLGMKDNVLALARFCTNSVATGPFGVDNTKEDQRWKIGSATVSMTETRFEKPRDNNKTCTIEHLYIRTGDAVVDMGALAAILRRIQSLCAQGNTKHIAITARGSWCSGLLKQVGFKVCDCELLYNNVSVLSRLCMDISIPSGHSPRVEERVEERVREGVKEGVKEGDNPMSLSSVHERDNRAAVASNTQRTANVDLGGSRLGKKKYCMHWILKGECAYMQTGCKYEHEIPVDRKTRDEIGMGDIPQWFKNSRYWSPWLQKLEALKRGELAERDGNKNTLTVQRSRSRPDPRAPHVGSRGAEMAPTTARGPDSIGPYTVEFPHHVFHQNTLASKIKEELSLAGPSSATTMERTNDTRRTGWRPDREIYQPPGAFLTWPAVKREDPWTDESSEISNSYVGEEFGGLAKRRKLSESQPNVRNR